MAFAPTLAEQQALQRWPAEHGASRLGPGAATGYGLVEWFRSALCETSTADTATSHSPPRACRCQHSPSRLRAAAGRVPSSTTAAGGWA